MYFSYGLLFASSWLIADSLASPVNVWTALKDPSNRWSNQTVLSFPGSAAFFNATDRWDDYRLPTYHAAVSPAIEEDVINIVRLATKHNIPFLATGGRHGFVSTLAHLQNGLALDLSQLNDVTVDQSAATLTIGPGVRFRDIFDPVYNAGFQIPTGTGSCVGMIGATIGAGIGHLNGLNGLLIDALLSVRIVTADGKVLEASKTKNSELFWGIRGAGANFGVILSATYKLYPLYKGGLWTSADVILPGIANVSFFNVLATLDLPPQLSVQTIMSYNQTTSEPQLLLSLVYAGPRDEGLQVMAPILDLNPLYTNIQELAWNVLDAKSTFGLDAQVCKNDQIYDVYALNLRTLSSPTFTESFDKIAAFWEKQPLGQQSVIVFETWPTQGVLARPNNSTAFPWRDAATYVMIQMRWDQNGTAVASSADTVARELRSDLVATSGYDDLTVYINYAHGDETLEQRYGANKLPRLAKLKAKYDPDQIFSFSNGLPTSYP